MVLTVYDEETGLTLTAAEVMRIEDRERRRRLMRELRRQSNLATNQMIARLADEQSEVVRFVCDSCGKTYYARNFVDMCISPCCHTEQEDGGEYDREMFDEHREYLLAEFQKLIEEVEGKMSCEDAKRVGICNVCDRELSGGIHRYNLPGLGGVCLHCAETKTLAQIIRIVTDKRRLDIPVLLKLWRESKLEFC